MPEDDKQDLVDIDTSGPGAEVELEEEKVKEVKEETTNEQDKTYENEREEKLDEAKVESKTEEVKEETKKEEPKEELEQYSEGVQKRIAKLTNYFLLLPPCFTPNLRPGATTSSGLATGLESAPP